jgi:hypothetical protein
MKAIEINSKTDHSGLLKIDYHIGKSEKKVRILLLLEDDTYPMEEEKLWMEAVSNNPAFNFLNEPEEDVYSLNDGEPIND